MSLSPSEFDVLLTLVVLGDTALTGVYRLFPFRFDRAQKLRQARDLLTAHLLVDLLVLIAMGLVMLRLLALNRFNFPDELQAYGLGLLIVGLLHGATVRLPAAWMARDIDRTTLRSLRDYGEWVAASLYGDNRMRADAFSSLRNGLQADTVFLQEYSLLHHLRAYVEADYIQPETGRYILARIEDAGGHLGLGDSPFAELNFLVSLLGLATLASLLIALQ